jgi:hypothetical protein
MTVRRRLPLLAALGACAALGATVARAQATVPSPFLPPGASASGGATDPGALELRGYMSTPQGTRYCIYDPAKKASVWSGVDERGLDFLIKSADPGHRAVLVESEGRTQRLVLQEAKILAMAALPEPGRRFERGRPNAQALTPAEEAARLQAVAEEVRRRRLQREESAERQEGGAPVAPDRLRRGGP